MLRYFYALSALMLFSGCSQNEPLASAQLPQVPDYVEAERIPAGALPEADMDQAGDEPVIHYRGGTLRPNGRMLEVLDAAGTLITVNRAIIQSIDESENCPASGFNRIVVKGDFFTIEQQRCDGMYFADEYITFKAASDGRIYLHRFSIVKTDRDDPDREIPQQDLTTREFGQIELKDVDLVALYQML